MVTFSLDTTTKLLQHSDTLVTPSQTSMCCSPSHFSYILNGSWFTYDTYLGEAWYGLVPSLTCNENVHLKIPIPENILSEVLNISCDILAVSARDASLFWAGNKIIYVLIILVSVKQINFLIFVCLGLTLLWLFIALSAPLVWLYCDAVNT